MSSKGLELRMLTHVDNWGMTVLRWRGRWRHAIDDDDTWWWLYCDVDPKHVVDDDKQNDETWSLMTINRTTKRGPRTTRVDCTAMLTTRGQEWHVRDDCTANVDTWSMTILQWRQRHVASDNDEMIRTTRTTRATRTTRCSLPYLTWG
jgi:hypothetical protein